MFGNEIVLKLGEKMNGAVQWSLKKTDGSIIEARQEELFSQRELKIKFLSELTSGVYILQVLCDNELYCEEDCEVLIVDEYLLEECVILLKNPP